MATYEIIIRQGKGKGKNEKNLAGGKDEKEDENEDNVAKESDQIREVLKYTAMQSARQLVVSKVGETTRNNILQQKVNALASIATTVMAFEVDPVYGAINLTIGIASQMIDTGINISRQSNRLGVLAERAGYINRSRND